MLDGLGRAYLMSKKSTCCCVSEFLTDLFFRWPKIMLELSEMRLFLTVTGILTACPIRRAALFALAIRRVHLQCFLTFSMTSNYPYNLDHLADGLFLLTSHIVSSGRPSEE